MLSANLSRSSYDIVGRCIHAPYFNTDGRTDQIEITRVEGLEKILRSAAKRIQSGLLKNEAQVKQAVIVPVLRGLNWDDTDPAECVPEFPAGNGQVDYALCRMVDKPVVFIEAKRLDGASDKGVEQLFGYANNRGIPLLILTDGNTWDFYLSMAEGIPADRRFYRMELRREERFPEYIKFLETHLLKSNVVSGLARREAERRHENNLERGKAKKIIPKVWQSLLVEPDEMLRDVLAEAVESECGTKPELDDVEAFLKNLSFPHEAPTTDELQITSFDTQELEPKRKKIIGFILDGREVKTGIGNKTLAEVLKELQRRDPDFMMRFAPKTVGRTRRLVAENPDDLYKKAHLKDDHSLDLGNGWWLGINLSSSLIRKYIKIACEVAGVNFGRQLILIEH